MKKHALRTRFRGFLPVVIDVETAGFDAQTDALLEIAAVCLNMDAQQQLYIEDIYHEHIEPFPGANLVPAALEFTGIQPYQALRFALPEAQALTHIFAGIKKQIAQHRCQRAVLVGHNPFFDLSFILAASARSALVCPLHRFTTFDTATLAAMAVGQTVLAKSCLAANIAFDTQQAHSALYDAQRTAELFCYIVNRWQEITMRV